MKGKWITVVGGTGLFVVYFLWKYAASNLYGQIENNGFVFVDRIYRTGTVFGLVFAVFIGLVAIGVIQLLRADARRSNDGAKDRTEPSGGG